MTPESIAGVRECLELVEQFPPDHDVPLPAKTLKEIFASYLHLAALAPASPTSDEYDLHVLGLPELCHVQAAVRYLDDNWADTMREHSDFAHSIAVLERVAVAYCAQPKAASPTLLSFEKQAAKLATVFLGWSALHVAAPERAELEERLANALAEIAYDQSEPIPFKPGEVQRLVAAVTGKAASPTPGEWYEVLAYLENVHAENHLEAEGMRPCTSDNCGFKRRLATLRAALASRESGWTREVPDSEEVWVSEWSEVHGIWREPWRTKAINIREWSDHNRGWCLFLPAQSKPAAPTLPAPPPADTNERSGT